MNANFLKTEMISVSQKREPATHELNPCTDVHEMFKAMEKFSQRP